LFIFLNATGAALTISEHFFSIATGSFCEFAERQNATVF